MSHETTIRFIKKNIKKYETVKNFEIFVKKKINLIPIKNINKYNLTVNGFQYMRPPKDVKDILKVIGKKINKCECDQKQIEEVMKRGFIYTEEYNLLNIRLNKFLENFCKQKNNIGVKNVNKNFTHVINLESVYRNSYFETEEYKKKMNYQSKSIKPPVKVLHTDKYKNETLTDWLQERRWWIDRFKANNILPYKYLKDYKYYNNWSNFYEGKYVTVLNIWISLSDTTLNSPLFFCDKYSYEEDDLIPFKYKGVFSDDKNLYASESSLRYNKNQKFYYYPKMKKYDMIIFESIETPHSSGKLKNSHKYKPRESLEFRYIVLNMHKKNPKIGYTHK